jgi:hypothetical protein
MRAFFDIGSIFWNVIGIGPFLNLSLIEKIIALQFTSIYRAKTMVSSARAGLEGAH